MSSGFLLINKPSGPTSHDIIDRLRRITGIKKIGHAGTLDPFASGLLIVGIGREATRELGRFLKLDKEYVAQLHLGAESDTYDRTGGIKPKSQEVKKPAIKEIEQVLEKFRGELEQVPPMYSAKKVKGKKLYELARQGQVIERAAVRVKILKLEIVEYQWPELVLSCQVSSGTYIRSLAQELGRALHTGAYLQELQRTAVDNYRLAQAIDLDELNQGNWVSHIKHLP
jgi:tRNA pseudouridine55 synthase